MKLFLPLCLYTFMLLSCNRAEMKAPQKPPAVAREIDANIPPPSVDSHIAPEPLPDTTPKKAGIHPVSLHWISWEKKGKVNVRPRADGWYDISGGQSSKDGDFLKIEGRIRRIALKELEFDGTITTRAKINNGGEPCVKKGLQRFYGKGNRSYYRLQNMENCEGGNLVDYVDIFPGTSSL